jgi:hypothetical protein
MELTQDTRAQAPGCFGAASVYSMDSEVCGACPATNQCRQAAYSTLELIKDRISVSDIMALHEKARQKMRQMAALQSSATPSPTPQPAPVTKPVLRKTPVVSVKFELSADQKTCLARITNKKAQEFAMTLCSTNIMNKIKDQLAKGVNPFPGKPDLVRITCDMLLNGGFTKASLMKRLMDECGWTEGTAGSQRAIIFSCLEAFDFLQAKGEHYTLSPTLG